ncbi:MAG: redoxin domain-containing protein [Bacteroidota bacterium]
MKNNRLIVFILVCLAITTQAQQNISGTFSPADDYKWLIVYQLRPGSQAYIADTAITGGSFKLTMPQNAQKGTYRLVYAVPQEEFYFDFIYNGEEAIELSFNMDDGVSFITSRENQLFNEYFKKIHDIEQEIMGFFTTGKTDEDLFLGLVAQLKDTQKVYGEKSIGTMAHHFIMANSPYIPSGFEAIEVYLERKKESYFKALDFKNPVLQASGFLTDKIINYVFTALPLAQLSKEKIEDGIQKNLIEVDGHLKGLDTDFKMHLYYNLWSQTALKSFNANSDFIYHTYLGPLLRETDNKDIINEIERHNRLRFGEVAPELLWKNAADETIKLSALSGFKHYVLVFWSSSCSHCLNELPKFHEKIKEDTTLKVIAVGLEDDTAGWKTVADTLTNFTHAISLGKWESAYAKLYAIEETPSYFVLDKDKKIIAKPNDYKEVLSFLESNQL